MDRTVLSVHVAKASRLPMVAVDEVVAEAGRGLVGDRYHGTKHRHVTVQAADALAEAADQLGRPVPAELTRRNLTVSGPEVPSTPGTRLRVGPALLESGTIRVGDPVSVFAESADNETGTRMALESLAALLEGRP